MAPISKQKVQVQLPLQRLEDPKCVAKKTPKTKILLDQGIYLVKFEMVKYCRDVNSNSITYKVNCNPKFKLAVYFMLQFYLFRFCHFQKFYFQKKIDFLNELGKRK